MWTNLRYSSGLRAPLIIFLLSLGSVALGSYILALIYADYAYALPVSLIMTVLVGLPLGLGSILIFLGLRLKAQGDNLGGYGLVLGLGAFIFAWLAVIVYAMYMISIGGN